MDQEWSFRPIGWARTPFREIAEIPKGLGAQHTAEGTLELREDLAPGLQDIEGFSHLIVLWVFHQTAPVSLLTTPPNDTRPHGVFATRAPGRPNPIGLTVVELMGHAGRVLRVRGVDMLDGSPLLDIKPYLSSVAERDLRRGWLEAAEAARGGERPKPDA